MRVTCTGCSPEADRLVVRADPRFAHRSERLFARVLDFYRLRWEYEPHSFPIGGSQSFTPDFWLPELGTYFELTTARRPQRRKNHRLRRFGQLYPDKRVRLLRRRDLEELAAKYS